MTRRTHLFVILVVIATLCLALPVNAQIHRSHRQASALPTAMSSTPPFDGEQVYPSWGYETQGVAIADFDNDGFPDIAVASGCDPGTYPACWFGDVSIWLGNGDGTFRAGRGAPTAPAGARALLAADFNNDGNMDLAVLAYCGDN